MKRYGFRELGWLMCGVVVAVASYLVTTQGATERAHLQTVEHNIVQARQDIRDLQTEFTARASLGQLGEWNSVLGLTVPTAKQYLPDEQAIASLDQRDLTQTADASKPLIPGGALSPTAPAQVQVASADTGRHATAATAATEKAAAATPRDAVSKVRVEAVAMLDESLVAELRKRADVERSAFR